MKQILFALSMVAPLFAQGTGHETVPVPLVAIAVIAAGSAAYGALRISKKNK
jgi:hypothetical protein